VPGQAVGVVLIVPVALRGRRRRRRSAAPGPAGRTLGLALGSGVLGGVANLVFLAATGRGELSIVAVITALYPATTVVLARVVLGEYWTRVQVAGLLTAVAAIVLVSLG
jgi:drug/metabolite transporter (DMT)-like permease